MIHRGLVPIAIACALLGVCAAAALALLAGQWSLTDPALGHRAPAQSLAALAVDAGAARAVTAGAARTALAPVDEGATRCTAALPAVVRAIAGARQRARLASLCARELALVASAREGLRDLADGDVLSARNAQVLAADADVLLAAGDAFDAEVAGVLRLALNAALFTLLGGCVLVLATVWLATRRLSRLAVSAERATAALRASEQRNRELAHVDEVTQLANRACFSEHLTRTVAEARRDHTAFALMFIDLDGFKAVNDTLSHSAGDLLLKQVGARLMELVRDSDMVARLGGDEFVVVAHGVDGEAQATPLGRRIVESLAQPYEVEGVECHVTASIGITLFPEHGRDGGVLLKNADLAMYEAKRRGKNGISFFTARAESRVRERVSIETALRRALPRQELSLVYQPVVSLSTMRSRSVEALLRWHHPVLGAVPPDRFIGVAEECGLIVEIGEWVLHESCRRLREWRDAGAGDVQIAVNVSPHQLLAPAFVHGVEQALARHDLPGEALVLEMTETVLMSRRDVALAHLEMIRALGVQFALDDFGTGYSSLSYLHTMPVDYLKIDRSFLGSARDEHRAIVLTILGLARILDLGVVAEGVEDEGTALFLADAGCTFAQGFHFARPVPAEQIDWDADYRELFHPESDVRRLMRA